MDDLIEIYRRIEYLRNNGLKMKEIADFIDMAPSVLSALYSSVLPTYVTSLKQGHSEENHWIWLWDRSITFQRNA